MPSTRRLAAILFADITGYTAMMQRDEADGMRRLKRFRTVLEESVAKHGGNVLQHIGDGSLVLFSSAVEAVASAKEVQILLQVEPKVPLRIGIHVGDIIEEDGQIFGDGVNLASRIESLGIPGAILITERVLPDLRSHPEFSTVSLGKFDLKNVSEPMEVFAVADKGITVPSPDQLSKKPISKKTTRFKLNPLITGVIGLVLLSLLALVLYPIINRQSGETGIPDQSIGVLPFRDLSADGTQAFFGDGIAEDILNALAQVEGLKVAGRTSSFSFRDDGEDLKEIGKKLGVSTILEGSIRKAEQKIRVTAQLVDTQNGYQLWSKRYDKDIDDIFAIQDEIAKAVADNLKVILLDEGVKTGTLNQEAYEWYLRGRYMLSQRSDGVTSAIDYFNKALEADAEFAKAYAGLGNAYMWLGWNNYLPSKEAFSQANHFAKQALEHDAQLAYAHAIQGAVLLWYEWDWNAARKALKKAISLNKAEASAFLDLGWLNAISGDFEEGEKYMLKAVALDPLNLEYNIDLADIYRMNGQFSKARAIINEMESLNTNNSEIAWIKGMIAYSLKDYDQAIEDFRTATRLSDGDTWSSLHLAMALGAANRTQEGEALLKSLEQKEEIANGAMVEMVPVYWNLGHKEVALSWLEKAYEGHANWLISLKVAPEWDMMRKESRFQEVLKSMNFPE